MMQRVPIHDGLFTADGKLLAALCRDCNRWHFPADADCPYCSGEHCDTKVLGGSATLWLFTGVTNRPPGYVGDVPFGFGVVELPEGLRLITRLTEADPAKLRVGMPMQLAIVPLHMDDQGREVTTYAFAPAEDAR
jgi:uncharacterized OB-fold protein